MEKMMTKTVLILWALANGVITEPQEIGNFKTMAECEIAAESLTESNPRDETGSYAVIAKCAEVSG